jgi:transcriptional regulator with XRE-family HTH domain
MASTAILIADIIGSKKLSSQPGGHVAIRKLCQAMRSFLDAKLEQLNRDGTLEIVPQNPQGDDVQYRLQASNLQSVADFSLEAVIDAFSTSPDGKSFRYLVYSVESDVNYQPRIKSFSDISKTEQGKKFHVAVERGLVSELSNPETITWLKSTTRAAIRLELIGEPWTGVHVDLFCRVSNDGVTEEPLPAGVDQAETNHQKPSRGSAPKLETRRRGDRAPFGNVNLSEDDRLLLREILTAIGMDQKRLAGLAGVTPAWLSQMFKGQPKGVDSEKLERVANVLCEGLTNLRDSRFPAQRVRVALATLSRFSRIAAATVPSKVYPAGGPVPVDGTHYVQRDADEEARVAIERFPFTMVVRGPVQCGKSSLLARLEHNAREMGIETAWFDPKVPTSPQSKSTRQVADANSEAAILLSELLQTEWELEPIGDRELVSIQRVVTWLSKTMSSTRSKPRLLILDDLAKLGPRGVEGWSQFVRAMHNKRATGGPQVSIAVGMTYHFVPNFEQKLEQLSSAVNWWPRIELGWFNREQVEKLANMVTGESSTADSVYELFKGQPYLTHAGALDAGFRDSLRHWTIGNSDSNAEPVLKSQIYRRHLNEIRSTVLGPTLEANEETLGLLNGLVGALSGQAALDRHQRLFLERAGMLTEAGTPALPIYRLIARDIARDLIKSVRS